MPLYFKDQSVTIISYAYTRPIASKSFNYRQVLRDLNIDDFKSKSPDCTCAISPMNIAVKCSRGKQENFE
jgi:hypothetical protein